VAFYHPEVIPAQCIMIETHPILDRLLEPLGDAIPIEYARKLVELRASPADQTRIDERADKCNDGLLTPDEREEYERYVQAIQVITVLQMKARRVLADTSPSTGS
jgi:hypothetical protein